jgi:hypothetical protein
MKSPKLVERNPNTFETHASIDFNDHSKRRKKSSLTFLGYFSIDLHFFFFFFFFFFMNRFTLFVCTCAGNSIQHILAMKDFHVYVLEIPIT